MSKKIILRLLILSCLIVSVFAVAGLTEAKPQCPCITYCRQAYQECLGSGRNRSLCFYDYENCLDYTCADECG